MTRREILIHNSKKTHRRKQQNQRRVTGKIKQTNN